MYLSYFFLKICDQATDNNIVIEESNSGVTCKVTCPQCNTVKVLSSSTNKTTDKHSFSIHNFLRHYYSHTSLEIEIHHDDNDQSADQISY